MAKKPKQTQFEKRKEREERAAALKERLTPISTKDVIKDLISKVPVTGEIPDEIVAQVMELEDLTGRKMTRQQLMVHAMVNRAMSGSVDAFRELLDRTEGKVANKNENKNMNLTYEDWLKAQAGEDGDGESA